MKFSFNLFVLVATALLGLSLLASPTEASNEVKTVLKQRRPREAKEDGPFKNRILYRKNGRGRNGGRGKHGGKHGAYKHAIEPGIDKPKLVNFHLAPFGDDPFFFGGRVPIELTNLGDDTKIGTEFVFFEGDNLLGEAEYYYKKGHPPYTGDIQGIMTGTCQVVNNSLGPDEFGIDVCILKCTWCISYEGEVCSGYGYVGGKRQLGEPEQEVQEQAEDKQANVEGEEEKRDLWEAQGVDCFPVAGELTASGNIFLDLDVPEDINQNVTIDGAGGYLLVTGSNFDLGAAWNGGFVTFDYTPESGASLADYKIGAKVPFTQEESCWVQDYAKENLDLVIV